MPRTKLSKNTKRHRDAIEREEKLRDFDKLFEEYMESFEMKKQTKYEELEMQFRILLDGASPALLGMNFSNAINLDINKLSDLLKSPLSNVNSNSNNDDGYITEESGRSGNSIVLRSSHRSAYTNSMSIVRSNSQRGKTPGPGNILASARRRSRSACEDPTKSTKMSGVGGNVGRTPLINHHVSRNKLRTPMASRSKALSADRSTVKASHTVFKSPASAFLRWPKPGEIVVSEHGSPVVAQVLPDKVANVNIPFKDGVLSLRPKTLSELPSKFVENLDPETLHQIKTLQANLDLIVTMAKNYE